MEKTFEEKKAIVEQILFKKTGRILTETLRRGTLQNKVFGTACTGYKFEIGTLNYRGVWVSTIEDIQLWVDGEEVPKEDMLFYVSGTCMPVDDLGLHTDLFWGTTDTAYLSVNKIGGLAKGDHEFEILIQKRADFGHSWGEGEEGYEDAREFHTPRPVRDKCIYTIE